MKNFKYILVSFFIIATLIPQLALASWWNPFSWKVFHIAEPVPPIKMEVQKQLDESKNQQPVSDSVINPSPTETTKLPTNTKANTEAKKPTAKSTIVNLTPPVQVVDVCLNIEGIQSQVPSGYSSVSNICTLINIKDYDYCPNIEGIQPKIPNRMFLYRNTNECLTEDEIEVVEDKNSKEIQDLTNEINNLKEEVESQAKVQKEIKEKMELKSQPPTDSEAVKIENQIVVYLQKLDSQIVELKQKIAIAKAIAQNTPPKPTSVCQGTKTGNGCQITNNKISIDMGSTVNNSTLTQLVMRKEELNKILLKLKKDGIKAITGNDIKFLSLLSIIVN